MSPSSRLRGGPHHAGEARARDAIPRQAAAGSFIVLLLGVYSSSQIFLGAEFPRVLVEERDGGIRPDTDAVKIPQNRPKSRAFRKVGS